MTSSLAPARPYYWAYLKTAIVGGVRRPVGRLVCHLRVLRDEEPGA